MPDTGKPTVAPARHLHGRRKGKRLTARRQALLDSMLPRLALALPPAGTPLDPAGLFGVPRRALWLEIGFGKGEHLAWQARHHPEIGFIGCEPFVNGVAGLASEIAAHGLDNICMHMGDARDVIDALPAASVARVFLLHPDPWPKARHAKRRFVAPDTLDALARVMADAGELRIATDDAGYSAWTAMQMAHHGAFDWLAESAADWTVRPADWPATRYEAKARRAGRHVVYLRYRRRARGCSAKNLALGGTPAL
ncbi:MAG: tRNA (guanosine(46)-N7)-methyltransferase TrmB [Alphaproteobacteria bacterium]|nr:MAG: tRNA (guanosine(46)-N7)-methyltransferase TrmB [Alphaproteobacteria bacterium]